MNKWINKWIKAYLFWGISIMFAMSYVMTTTFLDAYRSEDKSITININCYQEATLELIIVLSAIPALFLVWGYVIFHLKHERRSNANELPDNH
jgi:hypothetical protein